jgi:hypothetical protein
MRCRLERQEFGAFSEFVKIIIEVSASMQWLFKLFYNIINTTKNPDNL